MDAFQRYKEIVTRLDNPQYNVYLTGARKKEFIAWREFLWRQLSGGQKIEGAGSNWDTIQLYSNFCRCCFTPCLAAAEFYVWCLSCLLKKHDSLTQYHLQINLKKLESDKASGILFERMPELVTGMLQCFLFENFNIETVPATLPDGYTHTVALPLAATIVDKSFCKKKYYGTDCNCGNCPQPKPRTKFVVR